MIACLLALATNPVLANPVFANPAPTFAGGEEVAPTTPPAAPRTAVGRTRDVEQALAEGVGWLIENQNPRDGSWGSHHSPRPIEIFADVPGSHDAFRVGTTALCVMALADAGIEGEEVARAYDAGIDALLAQHDVKRVDGTEHYNVWAFGYTLQAFGEHLSRRPDGPRAESIRAASVHLVEKLGRYQDLDGGWGYLSLAGVRTYQPSFTSMSFTTATILVGLERVIAVGVEVPERLLERALDQVASCRTPLGSFTYGKLWNRSPAAGINVEKGAACRTPACYYSLDVLGREVKPADYKKALEDLLIEHLRFQIVALRRPIPHESWYGVSGYFYLYGCAYAAYAMERVDPALRRRLSPHLADAVLQTRQPDGSFWDYTMYSYHKPYGTAYALIALSRLDLPAR